MSSNVNEDNQVSRRRLIQAMGMSTAASLAGCVGGEDDGNEPTDSTPDGDPEDTEPTDDDPAPSELGERVPEPLLVEYWSGASATEIVEDFGPIMVERFQDVLGIEVEYVPVEFSTQLSNVTQDRRTHHVTQMWYSSTPTRLDPHPITRRFSIDWAGGNGRINPPELDELYVHRIRDGPSPRARPRYTSGTREPCVGNLER